MLVSPTFLKKVIWEKPYFLESSKVWGLTLQVASFIYLMTHFISFQGRSSNSGHYVGWSKNPKTNQWYMFDDEDVVPMQEEDILKLSGGGDWHTAYVLFYSPRRLEAKFTKPDYKLEGFDLGSLQPAVTATAASEPTDETMEVKKD